MKLLDKFRAQPEWQSDDPATRVAAVRGLSNDDDAQELLVEIARHDTDPGVRREAISRIDDVGALVSIAEGDADVTVRAEAEGVLRELVIEAEDSQSAETGLQGLSDERDLVAVARSARLESASRTALSRLHDPRALSTVARRSTRTEIAEEALSRLNDADAEQILAVAVKAEDRSIAVRAFERLAAAGLTRDALEQMGKQARQKAVRRRALAALSAVDDALDQSRSHTEHVAVCEAVEALAAEDDLARGRGKLDELLRRWSGLEPAPDEAVRQRFREARSAAESRLAALDTVRSSARERDQRHEALFSERRALCERIEQLPGDTSTEDLRTLREAWDGLSASPRSDSASESGADRSSQELEHRFQRAVSACARRQADHLAARLRVAEIERLLGEMEVLADKPDAGSGPPWNELERDLTQTLTHGLGSGSDASRGKKSRPRNHGWERLATVAGQGDLSGRIVGLRQRFDQLLEKREVATGAAKAERERAEKDNLARLLHQGRTVEGLVLSDKLRLPEAERQLRSLRRLLDDPGPIPRREREFALRKLKHAHTALLGRVRELRDFADWQRWANLGVQEELCRRMEGLAESSTPSEAGEQDAAKWAQEFLEIMARWRQASDVPKDRGAELADRFRVAHDIVAPRCQGYFEAQEAERQRNLARQRSIVEEAETLASSTDWLKTLDRITALQEEWKTLKPVPRHDQKELWRRFRAACSTFFTRRKADLAERKKDWSRNLTLKEALVKRVEALADGEDLAAAVAEAKQAQAEWKKIGPVRRNRSDAIWKRFRAACDKVFDRVHEKERAAASERVAVREALCVELESLLPTDESSASKPDDLEEQVRGLQQRWRAAPELPPALSRPLTARFGQAIGRLVEAYPEVFRGTALDPARKLKRLQQLCERVEAIKQTKTLDQEGASPAEILATKWRDALASNLMGARVDEASERRVALEEVKRARADCRRLGSVTGEEAQPLLARFYAACDRVQRWAEPSRAPRSKPRSKRSADAAAASRSSQ